MKISVAIAGVLLVGGAVAGCSGGSGSENDAYCKDVKKAQSDFSALGEGDFAKLDEAFKTFHTLADEAPSKIEPDWKVLESAITSMEKGFKEAGLKVSDLAEMQQGKLPEGVDPAKLEGLVSTMSKFSDAKFKTASDRIAKHAKDVCKVDINS